MASVDCDWLRAMVVDALHMLAAPPETQIEFVRRAEVHQDELALQLEDVREAFLSNCDPPNPFTLALKALDGQLDKMSGQPNARFWTDEALMNAAEWMTVRRFAARCLVELDDTPASAPDVLSHTLRSVPVRSRELAVYGLVLRHMVTVGHGGGQPSRLRGFSVLNRVIDDVEDPEFDNLAFEDEQTGLPMSPGLMNVLENSLRDVTDIEFVPRFRELIDLQATGPLNVKGSRGLVALGPIRESSRKIVVGVFFHAGGRWSRSTRYELVGRNDSWGITNFDILMIS